MSQKRKLSADADEEASVSLQEVIEQDEEMRKTADAVLGGSDDINCTYPGGYVARQALYACSTCSTVDNEPAGVCLACSLECHKDHELYELYTKRNFRCDCGNSKFANKTCKLFPEKENVNQENKYNQNFKGLYCSCNRPYPDDEDEVEDEMMQCVVCEDWFHGRHLGETTLPSDVEFAEMVCFKCTEKCRFLHKYRSILVAPTEVEIIPEPEPTLETALEEDEVDVSATDSKGDGEMSSTLQNEKVCQVKYARRFVVKGATFWPDRWRLVLCDCKGCKKEHKELGVEFITELSDTVKEYEDNGKKSDLSHLTSGDLLQGMPQMQKIEMLHSYNEMKEELGDYLKKFADEGKVVTASDITAFFNDLTNKRQKFDMPFSCR